MTPDQPKQRSNHTNIPADVHGCALSRPLDVVVPHTLRIENVDPSTLTTLLNAIELPLDSAAATNVLTALKSGRTVRTGEIRADLIDDIPGAVRWGTEIRLGGGEYSTTRFMEIESGSTEQLFRLRLTTTGLDGVACAVEVYNPSADPESIWSEMDALVATLGFRRVPDVARLANPQTGNMAGISVTPDVSVLVGPPAESFVETSAQEHGWCPFQIVLRGIDESDVHPLLHSIGQHGLIAKFPESASLAVLEAVEKNEFDVKILEPLRDCPETFIVRHFETIAMRLEADFEVFEEGDDEPDDDRELGESEDAESFPVSITVTPAQFTLEFLGLRTAAGELVVRFTALDDVKESEAPRPVLIFEWEVGGLLHPGAPDAIKADLRAIGDMVERGWGKKERPELFCACSSDAMTSSFEFELGLIAMDVRCFSRPVIHAE